MTQTNNSRFINILKGTTQVGLFDTDTMKWVINRLHLGHTPMQADFSYYELTAYASGFENLQSAKFDRNRDGVITAAQRPRKLTVDEVVALTTPKQRKHVTPVQQANLNKGGLTDENRYKKPKIVTDEVLSAVAQYRIDGLSWAEIGIATGFFPASVKTAFHRQQQSL